MSTEIAAEREVATGRARRFALAIQDVMGLSGLATVLRQAGVARQASALPATDDLPRLKASEFAGLMQAIENYYGRGARGTLTRIGYASFQRLVESQRTRAWLLRAGLQTLPLPARRGLVLRWLATQLAPPGRMRVHLDDQHLAFIDEDSLGTTGRAREGEICWVTVGEIQEALKWGTGREFEVVERSCKAAGAPACRFEVGGQLG